VEVFGENISMNGFRLPGGLRLDDERSRVLGYGVYQAAGMDLDAGTCAWIAPGPVEMLWRRSDDVEIQAHKERMNARMNERAATCGGQAFDVRDEREAMARLNELLDRWREGSLLRVRSCDICPDWTNRAQTGLSVDHVHYIADRMLLEGFKSRDRNHDGHDVPVLVRESASSELGRGALEKWRDAVAKSPGFPPFLLDGRQELFCSLGSGHFSQALNLFRVCAKSLWRDTVYDVGSDDALRTAVEHGVESVVLSADMPLKDRRFVSEMLNRSHGRRWHVGVGGRVDIDEAEGSAECEQFVALSKVLDAEELSCLVRRRLGQEVRGKAQGFVADTSHIDE